MLVLEMFRNAYRGERAVRAAQYVDIKTSLVSDMLTKVDRASMAVSLEVRVPLLDNDFVIWANGLPVSLKQRGSVGKHLMKKLARSRLSEQHLLAPKMGFDMPLSKWLRGPLKEMVYVHLMDSAAGESDWFDRAMVANTIRRHMDGIEDHSRVIWSLLFFEMWRRKLQ
jgi:asparagine synthase (glutamine-hydrolysing)